VGFFPTLGVVGFLAFFFLRLSLEGCFDGITSVEVGFDGIKSVEVGFDGITSVDVGFDGRLGW